MNYKGKAYYLNKSSFDISQAKKITGLKRKTKNDVVKKKGIAGDVLKGADYCYIYSLPDDSKPENCYACVPAGTAVNIINANYNKNWMKVKYKDLYVAYMKKADVKTADTYLAGTGREYQPYIKLAKQLKLTYTGILKDYSKTIKKKDLCRLAVLWYQAMGNKLPKQKTTSPFKANNLISDSQVGYMIVPFDNQNVCLDVYEESRQEGGTIGLWNCTGNNNQRFFIDYDGGNYSLKNVNPLYTLSYSGNKVCQRLQGYKS